MDDIEIAFLLAIILMTSYLPGEEKGSSLPENEADLVAALHTYCIEKEGTDTGRDMYILGQLKVMSECNIEHQQVILQLTEDHPGLQIPQLFMETYLAM